MALSHGASPRLEPSLRVDRWALLPAGCCHPPAPCAKEFLDIHPYPGDKPGGMALATQLKPFLFSKVSMYQHGCVWAGFG